LKWDFWLSGLAARVEVKNNTGFGGEAVFFVLNSPRKMAVTAEVAKAAEGKLRDALNQFKKSLSLTVDSFRPGLARKEEPINWEYWRKEINTPGLVDEMKSLYEKGLPESERVYITPELSAHVCGFPLFLSPSLVDSKRYPVSVCS
jgi:hypothetical protein